MEGLYGKINPCLGGVRNYYNINSFVMVLHRDFLKVWGVDTKNYIVVSHCLSFEQVSDELINKICYYILYNSKNDLKFRCKLSL